ncbi:UDP-glucosyltransferase 2-like [Amyelois transitella]|uniref:UDP-glucosyltransferase 2-like n=1 Tax=Amyelois transitella TaxID=680683 RepID=UPI00298FB919|nr:UDP-glucosyltransferase 2-like [Amyelois transitella]XP_060805881.1 UDP-glucosyltransferase 2-like [Amyelois transitella]XP_060805882.1 UDP-glucosyltransferase 2-like [Amyelois transitella]
MSSLTVCLIAALFLTTLCDGYKIMVLMPIATGSAGILGDGIVNNLLQAGHEVTYVTGKLKKHPPPNLHQVDVSNANEDKNRDKLLHLEDLLEGKSKVGYETIMEMIESLNRAVFLSPQFVELMGDKTKNFDAVIGLWMFSDIYSGLGHLFNCPFIWLSTVEPHWMVMNLIDENTHPAYVPDMMSANIPPFTFTMRIKELFTQIFGMALKFFFLNGYQTKAYEELLVPHIIKRGRDVVPLDVLKYNASLVLGNSHVSLGLATRLPQAYKPIGGYHIDTVVKPLPDDLKNLLDNAKDGLIYFSMGSNLKSKYLPASIKKDLLDLFGSLKQTVLWKFEEVLPNLPSNVHIVHWAPQQSILAHPNCIFFISHGGLLSTTEAVHFGKPIIGIPVFGDQFNNVYRAVKKGFAKKVNLAYDMKDKLKAAIDDLLINKSYAEKAKELSLVYHDRPVHPAKEMVHWVEHVVKTRGAPHLRSPALDVPLYQKLYLDLIALVLSVLYVVKKIAVKLCYSKKDMNKTKRD